MKLLFIKKRLRIELALFLVSNYEETRRFGLNDSDEALGEEIE